VTAEQIATKAIESILQGQVKALNQTAVAKALERDRVALRLRMERIAPTSKDQPDSFSLPKMENVLDGAVRHMRTRLCLAERPHSLNAAP
jgi:hypothetical protein